jgi:ribose 5-phosphate isomerase B
MVGSDRTTPANPRLSLAVGGDHAGFPLKGPLIAFLRGLGHAVEDCGSYDAAPVDFPEIAWAVCQRVREGQAERGVLICGSGVGACIAANKVPGIRASLIHDVYCAHQCVEHDDVNVACLGAQVIGQKLAEDCLRAFLAATPSTEEAFRRRVAKLSDLERRAAAAWIARDKH